MNVPVKELLEKAVRGAHERKRPSERNLRIADEVRVGGRTQSDVAREFGISQRRVSQICRQVDSWFASPGWMRGETCGQDEERAEEELSRRQLTEIYRRAMRAYARSERVLVTRRSGERKEGERWSETSEREQRLDTGSLRVALRAIEQRARIDKRKTPTYPQTEKGQVQYLEWAISSLGGLRREAEASGAVPRGPVDSYRLVEQMLRELLGGVTRTEKAKADETPLADGATAQDSLASDDTALRTDELGTDEGAFSSAEELTAEVAAAEAGDEPAAEATAALSDNLEMGCGDEVDNGYDEKLAESPVEHSAFSSGDDESRLEGVDPPAVNISSEPAPSKLTPSKPAPTEPTLAELRGRARAKVEYCYGMAIDDERLALELKLLAKWERGDFLAQEQSRDMREALVAYRRLLGSRTRVRLRGMQPLREVTEGCRA